MRVGTRQGKAQAPLDVIPYAVGEREPVRPDVNLYEPYFL